MRYVADTVAVVASVCEIGVTTDGIVADSAEGVVDVQVDDHVAVAAKAACVGGYNHCVVEVVAVGDVVDHIAVVARVGVVSVAADGVVALGAERIVDVQTDNNVTVAAEAAGVGGYNHRIAEVGAVRYVADHIAVVAVVGEVSVATDGVVADSAERVVDMQTNLDSAVAAFHGVVDSEDCSIVEVLTTRYVADTVSVIARVGEVGVAAYSVVAHRTEGVVDVQTNLDSAVATFHGVVDSEYGSVVEVLTVRYVADTVAVVARVGEVSVAADGVVADSTEGVVDMQTNLYSAVTTSDGTIYRQNCSIVEVGTVRYVIDTVTVVARVGEVCIATDGVVADSTEGVVDVQTDNHVAVAAEAAGVGGYKHCVAEVGAVRYVANHIAVVAVVGEVSIATDGVVAGSAEGVVYVQTNLDSAVAAFHGVVDSEDCSIVEVITTRYVADTVAIVARIGEVGIAADGVVTDCAEGVVDVQTYLDGAVATFHRMVDSEDGSVVEVLATRYIADTVAVVARVGEVGVATDGVVADSAEGVVDVQVDDHVAVAAENRAVGSYNHRIVEVLAIRYVADTVAIVTRVGKVCVAADGVVALGAECVVDNDIDYQIVETAGSVVAQILRVLTSLRERLVVGVERVSGTDDASDCVADGVVHRKVDVLYAVAARRRMQMLSVESLMGVADTILGVSSACAYHRSDSVADGVRHCNIHHKCEVAVCRCLQQLTVSSSPCVCLAVYGNTTAGADGVVDSVAKGVAHYNIDYQIIEAHGIIITQMLCVLSCQRIRLVVGVEGGTRTDYAGDGVADGVVHPDVHNHVAVTMADRTVRINEGSSVPILSAFEGKRLTCADGVVTLCAEGVVHVQTYLDSAVAAPYGTVDSKNGSVVEVVAVRYVTDTVAVVANVSEVSVATYRVVAYRAEGVVDMQTYLYSAVAAFHGTVHRKYGGIAEVGTVRYIADTIAVVACVVEVSVATDSVVAYSAEGVVDMKVDNHVAVAAEARCVGGYNHRIVEVVATRYVVDHIAVVARVGEVCVAAYRVVALGAERVVDMQVDNHVAVAAEAAGVGGYNHRIVEVGAMRYVIDHIAVVASVGEVSITTDSVVTLCAERVIDVQTYFYGTVATFNSVVHCQNGSITEVGAMRYVADTVAIVASVGKVSVAANGIVAHRAEGVVDVQTNLYGAVAASYGTVHRKDGGIVETSPTRYVIDSIAVVANIGEVSVAAYRIVAYRAEGVVDMQIDNHVAVAAEARCVDGYNHRIAEVGPTRYVADIVAVVASIDKCGVATDGVVALCAEGVVDMQVYFHQTVAITIRLVHSVKNRVVSERCSTGVCNGVAVVASVVESRVAAYRVVTDSTEGVVDTQMYLHQAVATTIRLIHCV